jgi:predicted alpha/beta-hydrolase family hydrolase
MISKVDSFLKVFNSTDVSTKPSYFYPTKNKKNMKTKPVSLKVSTSIGSVSAELIVPSKPKAIITLAHGAGAGMQHIFMVTLAQSLANQNIATLRFNFPFTENKKGRPDTPAVAHQAIEAAIIKAKKLFPELPLFAAGKSFGGRMTSQYMAAHSNDNVKGLIFYGFPLHAPGKPSIERAEHLKDVKVPMLFLSGSKDEFATWRLINKVSSSLPLAKLVKIEGANHGFKAGKQDIISVLSTLTNEWAMTVASASKKR